MANVIVCAGRYANHLSRIQAANVTVSDADSLYPAANLAGEYADQPWRPFRHASPPGADRKVTVDKECGINSGGELADMTGWTENNVGASNDVTNVSTPVNSGSRAFQMTVVTTGGGNKAEFYEDVPLRAGERGTASVALRGDGTRVARARFFIPETGQYLLSGGTLTTTPTDFATRSAATYATTSIAFNAPAYSVQVPGGVYTLRKLAYLDGASAGNAFVDDFLYWPSTDVAAIIGHNVMQAITALELRRDTAAFAGAGTLEATLAVYHPTLYNLPAAMRDDRYWRVNAAGTSGFPLWYGSLFLGQKLILQQKPIYDVDDDWTRDQIRNEVGGVERVYAQEAIQRRGKSIPWEYITSAGWQEGRDRMWRAGGFGEFPMLYIEDDTDPECAMYIRLPPNLPTTQRMPNLRTVDPIPVREMAFPTFFG